VNYQRLSPRAETCVVMKLYMLAPASRLFPVWTKFCMSTQLVLTAPALSEPPSKEPRTSAATMRRASGIAGRPRATSRAPQPPGKERKADSSSCLCMSEWRRGVGRLARQSGGES
jgi:hypothetical protein